MRILAILLLVALSVVVLPSPRPDLTPSSSSNEIRCDSSVVINQSSAATTQLVALISGKRVYVCSALVNQVGAATPPTFKFVYGTGSNCGTGTTDLTGVITGGGASTATNVQFGGNGLGYVFATPASQALCITTTTTQAQKGLLSYTQL